MMAETPPKQSLNPTALPLEDAATLLATLAKHPVTVDMLQADIAAGAPGGADGTLNLVHYAAWLVKELADDT
ncbi:MAG: hypothetical protein ABIG44_07930 [Planctomycetota bacterium]